ncbi:MAG: rRNA maturation RNase YbeY [Marinosulfonomonas sp.]|nr:MAG: rRNA maturation RNase YbeY [Marinosulfonomonas sp.]
MADLVDVLIEDERWAKVGLADMAQASGIATLSHLGLNPDRFEISLLGCNDTRIAALNTDFREKPGATNVLSWPSKERAGKTPGGTPDLPIQGGTEPQELGDIAIAYETCLNEAERADTDFGHHVAHLLVHATLHLLGYDHINGQDAALMEGIEQQILASMGHPDPYGNE